MRQPGNQMSGGLYIILPQKSGWALQINNTFDYIKIKI